MLENRKKYIRLFDQQLSLYENYARKHGLTAKSMLILMWLYYVPNGITQKKIVEKTYSTKQVVNATIKKWIALGYVKIIDSSEDQRFKLLKLTKQGIQYAEPILLKLEKIEKASFEVLTTEQQQLLVDATSKYVAVLSKLMEENYD